MCLWLHSPPKSSLFLSSWAQQATGRSHYCPNPAWPGYTVSAGRSPHPQPSYPALPAVSRGTQVSWKHLGQDLRISLFYLQLSGTQDYLQSVLLRSSFPPLPKRLGAPRTSGWCEEPASSWLLQLLHPTQSSPPCSADSFQGGIRRQEMGQSFPASRNLISRLLGRIGASSSPPGHHLYLPTPSPRRLAHSTLPHHCFHHPGQMTKIKTHWARPLC
jgi:hypothetical protein